METRRDLGQDSLDVVNFSLHSCLVLLHVSLAGLHRSYVRLDISLIHLHVLLVRLHVRLVCLHVLDLIIDLLLHAGEELLQDRVEIVGFAPPAIVVASVTIFLVRRSDYVKIAAHVNISVSLELSLDLAGHGGQELQLVLQLADCLLLKDPLKRVPHDRNEHVHQGDLDEERRDEEEEVAEDGIRMLIEGFKLELAERKQVLVHEVVCKHIA